MKTTIILLLLILCFSICRSQNLWYEIRSTSSTGVSKEKLVAAETLNDIRPVYSAPIHLNYTSTELIVHTSQGVKKAKGKNENLTAEQKSLLGKADVGNKISIEVKYHDNNPVTQFPDIHQMQFDVPVISGTEAMYPGGHDDLFIYLKENMIDKIGDQFSGINRIVVIRFNINESGKVSDVHLSETSANTQIDKLLLEVINNMPDWQPAKNAMGVKVQQEFEFTISNGC